MKLNAICVLKNEADIIEATLVNALKFCDNIYLLDNQSDDGSWELINQLAATEPRLHIIGQTAEVYQNQFRNRVYNQLHQQFSNDDWWYILDADELLSADPKAMLKQAAKKGCSAMDVWQAQFYYTDQDLKNDADENKLLSIPERRFYYQINWRELRFFKNCAKRTWSEQISGRIPPWCNKKYTQAPVCRHYAERSPEQIMQRRKIRINNPYSFLHVKNKTDKDWLKDASQCRYYRADEELTVTFAEQLDYALRQSGYWLKWRAKNVLTLAKRLSSIRSYS